MFMDNLISKLKFTRTETFVEQLSQIDELVRTASDYWQMIDDENPTDLDMYRAGYVNAMLSVIRIFGLSDKLIKK